jgi:hypothetical protein
VKKFLVILLVVLVSALSISGVVFEATEVSVNANPETTVGGIIWENTTWTLDNSPYIITDTVQIPENVVLTIEAGVVVESSLNSSEDFMFVLHGKIIARGKVDNKIVFDGGCVATGFSQDPSSYGSSFFTTGGALSDPQLILDNCVIKNGNRFYWGTRGHLNLTNSELTNLGLTFWGYNGRSQIYYPGQDVYIQNNLFINTTGFEIANLNADVFIRYNLFTENRESLVWNTQGGESRTFINYNSFIDVSGTVLRLSTLGDNVLLDATNNYWGTTNTSTIDSWILDGNDDINIRGVIEYSPILTEPHPDTPTLPIMVSFEYSPVTIYSNVEAEFDATASFSEYSSIANYTWNFSDSTVITLDTPTTTHVFSTSGEYNVTLTVTDEFGFQNNTSTTVTVLEDDAAPVTTDDYDEAWHTSDFTITLTAVDDESGVTETYYRINKETTKTVGANGQPRITTEGADNTLEYWSVDNAGNEEPSNLLTGIKLDKTPPKVETLSHLPERDELLEQTVSVSVKVTDLYSGVKNVTLSYNLNDETAWNDIVMTLNSTTGLYECIIPEQEENARVKYTITTYDNAENHHTEDNHGRYFVYTAVPEFPSWIILPLLITATLLIIVCKQKLPKTRKPTIILGD